MVQRLSNFSEMLVYSLQIFLLPLGFLLGSKCIFDLTLTTLNSATKNFSPWPNLEITIIIFMCRQFNKIKDAGAPEFSKKHPICAKKSHSLKSTKQTLKSHSTFTTKAMKTVKKKEWK